MTYNDYDFEYTKEFQVSSTVIDAVYFNENDNTVVLDVNDEFYKYDNVDSFAVARLVRGGDTGSVGTHYNTVFKKEFGPGVHLGCWTDCDWVLVPVEKNDTTPSTPKNLVDNTTVTEFDFGTGETKEYSLNIDRADGNRTSVLTVSDEPTKEFSLSFEEEAPEVDAAEGIDGVSAIVVHFTLTGAGDKRFKYEARDSLTVEGAIEELNDFVSRIGVTGRVRKVVVKFD